MSTAYCYLALEPGYETTNVIFHIPRTYRPKEKDESNSNSTPAQN